ncbi:MULTISPECIES: hypothetical protein [Sphingomonadaceae]|jgi:hypothetical protein|uniref:hypothetical protein n=1 Tax=Sphingomonadales TaxID=204457 RepID=UPI000390804A|nr:MULTISPECIES: hypothetical protein [Sphingomonadaceae]AGU69315.1 conserved protein of unknown function [Sphingomonas sp. ERG5]
MAILLPTSANIRLLKTVLMGDFDMRSAHATEAIAALIGFRSNLAYLTASNHWSDATVYDANFDAFEDRAAHLGYDRTSSEHFRFIFNGIKWPDPAWGLFDKRDSAGRDAWFYECQRRKIPFLHISRAKTYCTVHWDHISLDSEYDQMVRQAADGDIGTILFRTYQLIAAGVEPKSFFEGSALVGSVTGLSESSARQIANSFALRLFPGNVQSALAA